MKKTITIDADNGNWIGKIDEFESGAEWEGPVVKSIDLHVEIDGDLHLQ